MMVEQGTQSNSPDSTNGMKVYELAKELGMDSISLLDRLNSINIRVKNHMAELGPNEVQLARTSLLKKEEESSPKKKKAIAKAAVKTTETAAAAPKAAARTRKKAAEPTEAAVAAEAAQSAFAKSPILRRRTREGGETETVVANAPIRAAQSAGSEAQPQTYEELPTEAVYETEPEQQEEYEAVESETLVQDEAPEMTPESPISAQSPTVTTAAAEATKPTAQIASPRAPIILPPRPVAPRRSILKIVEPTALPQKPIIKAAPAVSPVKANVKGTAVQDKDGFRIIKMTKENLDAMVEEEAAKKRGGGGREAGIRPEDVRFADYRKKEMVFLPKRKRIPVGKELKATKITESKATKRVVQMGETITVQDLANQLSIKAIDVVRKLMKMGSMVNVNSVVDFDTATLIGTEFKHEVRNVAFKEEVLIAQAADTPESLDQRPPVVTIMGHVDHGKTSLLDALRSANVAAGEAGGITQHIGAYTVEQDGKLVTFIDTPGHEAFTVMRARGANVTDIVVLVVAADDGVMPQTREALSHAKAAGVPIIVAMNKMDKPSANPEKIKQQLAELDLLAEDWGGQTMFIPVSATKKTGLDKLIEGINLQAEVLELKANSDARASGNVLEARLERGRGPVVSLLIKRGTLRVGDAIVSSGFSGKVKAMMDHKGTSIKEAKPGTAAEVMGFEGVPAAGEKFDSPATEADAREIAENRTTKTQQAKSATSGKITMEDLFAKIKAGNLKELAVILKADVYGSVEAVRDSVIRLSNDQVTIRVIHAATGGITESDVLLATASNALVLGFNVRPETKARQLAEAEHIEIKCYGIIYELLDEMKLAMTGLLDKKKVEKFLGRAEVRQTFTVPKLGTIAGSSVIDGKILRGANVRLLRDSRIIFEGKMASLKRFKDDAKEVATGFECGIGLDGYNDLKAGDIIEAYMIEMITPALNPVTASKS